MSIDLTSLSGLDQTVVAQELDTARTLLQELFPNLDMRRGVYHDLVLYSHAALTGGVRTNLQRYLSARSLLTVTADPTLADPDVTDNLLSNWRLTRQPGGYATGEVTVILSTNTSVTLPLYTPFTANGQKFVTTSIVAAVPLPSLVRDPFDRLLTQMSDGNWAFNAPVRALTTGTTAMLGKDAQILPNSLPYSFVTSYAASDFVGGADAEVNNELLQRLQQGIAAKGAQNPVNMAALLREYDAFSRVQDMSILGMADPEMLRDRHSVFPISFGGRIDWYLRSQPLLQRAALVKTAVLVEKTDDARGIWQFSLGRSDFPGFYEVAAIRPYGAGSFSGTFAKISEERGLDLTGVTADVETVVEGAYTAYQTATLRFLDDRTDTASLALGAQQQYAVEVTGSPLVGELQALVAGHDVRCRPVDVLIKAAVPCFVQVNFTIYKRADEPTPDLAGIRNAVAQAVNTTGFIGKLYASRLTTAVHSYLFNSSSLGEIDLFGRIRRPDGSDCYLRDAAVLSVPYEPGRMVTANTVQFFTAPENIGITVETGVPMPT